MKARIVKTMVGVKTYYYSQIRTKYLFFFHIWEDIAWVDIRSGSVSWYRSLSTTKDDALKTFNDYENLFGVKLEISEITE